MVRRVVLFGIRLASFAILLTSARSSAIDVPQPIRWIRLPSDDFEILSTARENDADRLLEHLGRVRDFFAHSGFLGQTHLAPAGTPDAHGPVHVILFGSMKEFVPYRPSEATTAFYRHTQGRDYIVLAGTPDQTHPNAVHEYTHWMLQRAGLRLPPWLTEGVAELYSTLDAPPASAARRFEGGAMTIGAAIPSRLQALATQRWTPLSIILEADQNSPYLNEKDKAGSLYNESWALTHMLVMTPAYAPKFADLLLTVRAGVPSRQALETTYGRPLEAIEKDLAAYIHAGVFRGMTVSIHSRNPDRAGASASPAKPASVFDVQLALLDLANVPGKESEAQARFMALAALDPRRPEPQIALGYLAWRARRQEAALKYFGRAVELGSRDTDVLWNYGQLAAGPDPAAAERILTELLRVDTDREEARLLLAELQFQDRQPQKVLATLAPVSEIAGPDAPRLYRLRAFANADLGLRDDARLAARRWSDSAGKDPARLSRNPEQELSDRASAERFLEYLDRSDRLAGGDAASVMAEMWASAPPPDLSSVVIPDPPLPSVAGQLVALECEGDRSRLIVEAQGLRSFEFEDGERVMAFGPGARSPYVSLACGKFRPVAVRVQFEQPGEVPPKPAARSASEPAAVARAIYLAALPESLEPLPVSAPPGPARPVVAGLFVDMDCGTQPPKLVLRSPSERAVLLLDDVSKLEIGGLPLGSEIACGPQKGAPVWIEYEHPSGRQPGILGLVRVLHFEARPGAAK